MIKKSLMRLLDKKTKMSGWMLAEEMGAAAAIGAAVGILFTVKAAKMIRAEYRKAPGTMTIELHDLDGLKIERIE